MLKNLYIRLRIFGRGEWPAIALALTILIVWAALAQGGALFGSRSNFGFGPDWGCAHVCVKQPPKPATR